LQRLCWRLENFGFFLSFTRFAVVAILLPIVTSLKPFVETLRQNPFTTVSMHTGCPVLVAFCATGRRLKLGRPER
jgi:hypothetical protein